MYHVATPCADQHGIASLCIQAHAACVPGSRMVELLANQWTSSAGA